MSNVSLPYAQIIDPLAFKSVLNAKVYIGEYGVLPNPANSATWKQAYFVNSDGTRTAASQPIRTNAAGYAVDGSGNIKTVQVDGQYSLLVQDSFSATKYSIANVMTLDGASVISAPSGLVTTFNDVGIPDGASIYFSGRTAVGDGGGGVFRYSASSTQTVDGGLVFAPLDGTGRLFRDGWTVLGFNGAVNALWYGAVPGGADSTTALQAWLNANAVSLYLPYGEFKATGLTVGDKTIIGAGREHTTLTLTGTNATLLQMTEGGIELRNLTLKSAAGKTSVTTENGLVTATASANPKVRITEVNATGFSGRAFKLTDTYNLILDRLQVLSSNYGVEFDNITFSSTEASNGGMITNCYFGTCNRGLYTGKQVNQMTLNNNVFEFCTIGAELKGRNFSLINNYYENNITAGANYTGNGFRMQRKQTTGTDGENLLLDAGIAGGWAEAGSAGFALKDYYGSYVDIDSTQGSRRLTCAVVASDATDANNRSLVNQLYTGYADVNVKAMQAALTPVAEYLIETHRATAGNGIAQPAFVFRSSSINGSVRGTYGRVWKSDYTGNMTPGDLDNLSSNGSATNRWSVVYAGTGTINTSDEREKTFLPITDAVLDAWAEVEWRSFHFNDAIAAKGSDEARIHFGLGAQSVMSVFAAHGLDATRYALLCYDEWDEQIEVIDENGNVLEPYRAAGDRYGIRYVEALSLEAALLRRTQQRLEARLAALEAK